MPITQCIDNKYSYNKSISIITLHVAYTYPNIHASSTRLLTVLLHPRGKLLGHSPGTVYLGSDASMTLDHDMHVHGPISYGLGSASKISSFSSTNCSVDVQFVPKLCFDCHGSPQIKNTNILLSPELTSLQNTTNPRKPNLKHLYIHLLNASPLNIGINLVVRSQAQRPHSVGIVPEMLEMACDGEWFRVFQIYSGRIILMEFPSKAFSRLNKQESDHVWTLGEGWRDDPVILPTGV